MGQVRGWHLEHADGSVWTREDFRGFATRMRAAFDMGTAVGGVLPLLSPDGTPIVADAGRLWPLYPLVPEDDAAVVWDE